MEVTIRDAEPGDETRLRILRGQAIKATFQDEYDPKTVGDLVATVDADLPAWIAEDRYLVLIAETEITPVSYAVLDSERGELLSIMTSPDYRREGFGTQVLQRLESEADNDGHDVVEATVPEPIRPFFEAAGFEQSGVAEWHDIDAIRMHKPV
jgi:GNAT superfamily N-acetyltransferase